MILFIKMIKLSINTAVLIYILVNVILLLFWWVYVELKKSYNISFAFKGSLWECNICTYLYSSNAREGITTCPRCGSYNERRVKS